MSKLSSEKVYRLLEEIKSLTKSKNDKFFDIDEAAQYLGLKKSSVYNLVYKNKIPFYKPSGKKLYFLKSELDQWITGSRIQTIEEFSEAFENSSLDK